MQRTDTATCYGGAESVTAHLFSDSAGRVRKYRIEGGSGDSAGEATYYYDTGGVLRFTFTRLGAVNGTEREDRYYFDSAGALLYRYSRLLHGPGYPGGFDSMVVNPLADFRALCRESSN